ncbi:helix-turn-helix transcriptional regulator [Megasphaera stantonii]|uniref:helix-turn-helix transcriptional regulator n=1 Tax=Megasphaera stantonii TaxID=2144175 RepID=UPI00320B0E91
MLSRNKIASRLINLRKSVKKTQEEVARTIGISTSALAMYEAGERLPRDEVKIRLANYYNVSVEFIFFAE